VSVIAPPPAPTTRYAFVFVCQAGEIETKALLLAASLKRALRGEHELIAAVPTPAEIWGELSPDTRAQLHEFGVRIVPIENPIDPDYRIGNKLACIDVPTNADKIVFLDSDILCLRDFGDPSCLRVPFAAKPADLRTFAAAAETWAPLYAAVHVELPPLRLPTTVSGEFGLAYFNSGVIFVDNGLKFGQAWIDCANTIRGTPTMREQRHWLDQAALPLAVHRLGLAYTALDERYNFPAHLKPLTEEPPFFCHYHWPRIVQRAPLLLDLVRDLARAHPAIARVMAREPEWTPLLDPATQAQLPIQPPPRRVESSTASDLLISGIPGSGASDLLKSLGQNGCTTFDEPAGFLRGLASETPEEIVAFSRPGRVDGRVAVKCELAFLCRTGALSSPLPGARWIACVRDPFATIAGWKTQPQKEFDAQINWTLRSVRPWLTPESLAQLERVAGLADLAEKRAAWWWWLAQRLLERSEELTIMRDADLFSGRDEIARLLRAEPGAPARKAAVSEADSHPALDERDRQAIRAICMQAAAHLGVAG
jgi:hypothetical protein